MEKIVPAAVELMSPLKDSEFRKNAHDVVDKLFEEKFGLFSFAVKGQPLKMVIEIISAFCAETHDMTRKDLVFLRTKQGMGANVSVTGIVNPKFVPPSKDIDCLGYIFPWN